MDDECVFCRIVAGELPASTVAESATVIAFMDIQPVSPGHLLVVPKAHLPELADLDDTVAAEMTAVARRLAAALRRTDLRCDGVNLFLADGEAAGQEVFHCHLHVIPRFPGDGFVVQPTYGPAPTRAELDDVAARIRGTVVTGDE